MKHFRLIFLMATMGALGALPAPEPKDPTFVTGNWDLDSWWNYGDWQKYVNSQGWFVDGVWQVEANMDHAEHYRRQMMLLDRLRLQEEGGAK